MGAATQLSSKDGTDRGPPLAAKVLALWPVIWYDVSRKRKRKKKGTTDRGPQLAAKVFEFRPVIWYDVTLAGVFGSSLVGAGPSARGAVHVPRLMKKTATSTIARKVV